jgi:hypothetical protein
LTEILEWKCPECNKTHDGTVYKCPCGYVLGGAEPKRKQESGAGSRFKSREEYEAWKAGKIKEIEERRQSLRSEKSNINHYYQILGLKPNASKEEVEQVYKDLLTVWNPDKFTSEPSLQQKAREKVKEIDEAFEKLILYLLKSSEQLSRISQSPKNTTIVSPASGTEKEKLGFLLGNLFIFLAFFQGGLALLLGFIGGITTEVIPNRGVGLIVGVYGIGLALGLLKRKKIGLYLFYTNVVLWVIAGLFMIMQGTSVGMVSGLFVIGIWILWFRYFEDVKLLVEII